MPGMELSPADLVGSLVVGYWNTQAVYVAAKLKLADHLSVEARTAEDLAKLVGAHPQALYRLLRALASLGIFAEDADGKFQMTPASELLRSDKPRSMWALAVMSGEEHYKAWGELLYSVQTGQIAFEKLYGQPVFDFMSGHPEQAAVFDQAMVGIHGRETSAVLGAYDFRDFKTVADIGGGNGSMLCEILPKHPHLTGTLFDLPGVIARANGPIRAAGLADRLHLVDGDFFSSVPAGMDLYLLRHIIHDWDDDKSIRILQNVFRAMHPGSRVIVIESVIPPGNGPFLGKLLDLTMLTIPGGRERTEREYQHLFREAGIRFSKIIPTAGEVSLVEGIKD